MTLRQSIVLYLVTLAIFFAVDMVWLGVVAKNFYRRHLGHLMSSKVVWPAAILFYLLFIAGLVVFAVRPAVLAGAPVKGLLLGAFLGLIAYATYDLTNQATIKDWPFVVTAVDLVWGTALGGVVAWLSALAGRGLLKL
ncbi:MAG TPA: DUF2177 family protein [Candidatus Aminicenantes bacterium]|mgnify:CR=1 FL=1|nr:DUF2177 family protein [Candidatus Aminicenantes bacterium]HDT13414.1 DUF2177 family protein [Candidatus Aminicenantes bacterium]